jgi:hypothetical protein
MNKLNVFDEIDGKRDFKIRVTPEQSRKVQEYALESGYRWQGEKEVFNIDSDYLFFTGMDITTSYSDGWFSASLLLEAYFPEEPTVTKEERAGLMEEDYTKCKDCKFSKVADSEGYLPCTKFGVKVRPERVSCRFCEEE